MFHVTVRVTVDIPVPHHIATASATFDPGAITSIELLRTWAAGVAGVPESELSYIATRDADENDADGIRLLKDKRLRFIEDGSVIIVVFNLFPHECSELVELSGGMALGGRPLYEEHYFKATGLKPER